MFDDFASFAARPAAGQPSDFRAAQGGLFKNTVDKLSDAVAVGGYPKLDVPLPPKVEGRTLRLTQLKPGEGDAADHLTDTYLNAVASSKKSGGVVTPEMKAFGTEFQRQNNNVRGYFAAGVVNGAVKSDAYWTSYLNGGYHRHDDKPVEYVPTPLELISPRGLGVCAAEPVIRGRTDSQVKVG